MRGMSMAAAGQAGFGEAESKGQAPSERRWCDRANTMLLGIAVAKVGNSYWQSRLSAVVALCRPQLGGSGMHSAERLHVPVVLVAEFLTGAEASQQQHRRRRWRTQPESSRERSVKPAGQQREV
jgi:hypothetical protein